MRGVTTDLTGKRFGHLLVVGYGTRQGPGSWWHCACDCGETCVKAGKDLTKRTSAGWVHSCGCRPALTKSIYKRLTDQGDPRLKQLHVEQVKRG
ncbi:MAG TPA: hypothetical protein VFB63_19380 [Bryobacteraceae bacterium]|nr:hypothetical protein [Bryobacteraceae bacterium]